MENIKKVALITGATRGIGKQIAITLAKEGYNIALNYRKENEDLENAKKEITELGVRVLAVQGDVSKYEDCERFVKEIIEKFGHIDVLVNNAGITRDCLLIRMKEEDFKQVIDTNLGGTYNVTKNVISYMMKAHSGRIINISSTNGINTYYPMCIDYDASKAALISMTHNLAFEFAPYVNVNCIAPGFIGTENELDGYDEEFLKEETEKIMVNRYGKPEEVAYLVKFLISDEANFINNTIIRIDGGQKGSC